MIKYVIGGAIVGGFIGLVAFLSQADKKASKKIDDQFAAEHHVKDSYGMYMITEEGEFAFPLKSGTLSCCAAEEDCCAGLLLCCSDLLLCCFCPSAAGAACEVCEAGFSSGCSVLLTADEPFSV